MQIPQRVGIGSTGSGMGSCMGCGNGMNGYMGESCMCAGVGSMDGSGMPIGGYISNGMQIPHAAGMQIPQKCGMCGGMGSGMGAGNCINCCIAGGGMSAGVGGMDGSGMGMGCRISHVIQIPHAVAMQIPPGAYNSMNGGVGAGLHSTD